VNGLYEAAIDEIGGKGLDAAWHLVAARLRQALREPASEVGCDCGGLAWLEQEQHHHAQRLTEDE
jgi:hypothetical protein